MNIAKLLYVVCVSIATTASSFIAHAQQCSGLRGLEEKMVKIDRIHQIGNPPKDALTGGGTAWFHLRGDEIITNAHVVQSMRFHEAKILPVLISQHSVDNLTMRGVPMQARLLDIDYIHDVARLRLERPYIGARLLTMRTSALVPGEPIYVGGYPSGEFSAAKARLATSEEIGKTVIPSETRPFVPLSVTGKEYFSTFSYGVSGAPLLDCKGLVIGMMSRMTLKCVLDGNLRACFDGKIEDIKMPNAFAVKAQDIFNLYARSRVVPGANTW